MQLQSIQTVFSNPLRRRAQRDCNFIASTYKHYYYFFLHNEHPPQQQSALNKSQRERENNHRT